MVAAAEMEAERRWGGRRRGATLRNAFVDAIAVFGTAARLFVAHWPALISLCVAGFVGRELAMRGAARASDVDGVLGFLVLVFAPLSTLTALVLMLRVLRGSLPWLRMATANSTGATVVLGSRPRNLLNYLGSVLVPFLAVYASYGYLKQDVSDYAYRVLFRQNYFEKVDIFKHLPFTLTTTLLIVVAVAIVLRWLLSRFDGKPKLAWLGVFGAYLEVLWLTLAAAAITQVKGVGTDWVEQRRAVTWVQDGWSTSVERFGPMTVPAKSAMGWLGELFGSLDTVIVVPLAWLAVGAVVYGHKLAPPAPSGNALFMRAARKWVVVPRPIRRVGAELTADVRDRFTPLVHGLRLIIQTGLAPMLLFCLAFLIAQTAAKWLWELERLVIGPQDLSVVWQALDGPLGLFNDVVSTILLACLLGASVDRVLRTDLPATEAAPTVSTEPTPTPDAQAFAPAPQAIEPVTQVIPLVQKPVEVNAQEPLPAVAGLAALAALEPEANGQTQPLPTVQPPEDATQVLPAIKSGG